MLSHSFAPRGDGDGRDGMIRKFGYILLLTPVLIAWGAAELAAAQDVDPRQNRLLVLERLWNEAQVNRDSAALNAMIGSRFVNTEWDGEVSDKQKFLADIKDPLFKPTIATIQDVKMNFFGETAVVTGTYHAAGTYQGRSYDHFGRFTDTWIFDTGQWQCVAPYQPDQEVTPQFLFCTSFCISFA